MNDRNWSEYAEHRTGVEVDQLLHYGHIIPVSRGLTQSYVAEHFPGWTWNDLMAVWRAAGIVVGSAVGGPPSCDQQVKVIHFNGADAFACRMGRWQRHHGLKAPRSAFTVRRAP